MKMKKIVATGSALALTAAVAVGGTLAYLTADTAEVKNTFTYSKAEQDIVLDLNEHQLNADGITVGSEVVKQNEYKVLPGVTVEKDPYLTLTTENPSYIYVEVVNNAASVVASINEAGGTVFGGEGSNWIPLHDVTGPHGGPVYYWDDSAQNGTTETTIPVFDTITFVNDAPTEDVVADDTNISVYGYAIAVQGMGAVNEAWTTAAGDFQEQA